MIKNSIRNKLILFMLIATILPISASIIFTYMYTKESVKDQALAYNSQLIYQGKANLNSYMDNLNKVWTSVYNDAVSKDTLFRIIQKGLTDYQSKNEIYRSLLMMTHEVEDIYQVNLYIANGNRSYLVVNGNLKQSAGSRPAALTKQSYPYASFVEPSHISHHYDTGSFPYTSPRMVFSIHRPIYEVPNSNQSKFLGFLSIDVNLTGLENIANQLYEGPDDELHLLDENGIVIFSSDAGLIGSRLAKPWADKVRKESSSAGYFESSDNEFQGITVYSRLDATYLNWTLVKRIPFEHLYANARQLTQINSLIVLFFLIVVIIVTLYISIRITGPIKRLIRMITAVERGNLTAAVQIDQTDEIGILSRRFQQMMRRLNEMIEREYRLELANTTHQLKALQAQIDPHFLNNALQSIGTLALMNNERKIYSLISSLGKMMRFHMSTNEQVVRLDEEISHVKAYLELQHQRFEGKLHCQFAIDDSCAKREVPKMSVQPLIENYFKHGFAPEAEELNELRVSASETEDGYLRIEVADNGKGLTDDRLIELREQIENWRQAGQSHHIGLINVVSRLKLLFSEQARIELEAIKPRGLRITMLIPPQQGDGSE